MACSALNEPTGVRVGSPASFACVWTHPGVRPASQRPVLPWLLGVSLANLSGTPTHSSDWHRNPHLREARIPASSRCTDTAHPRELVSWVKP